MAKEFKPRWEMVRAILEENKRPMTCREIAEKVGEKFTDYRDSRLKKLDKKDPSEFTDIYRHDVTDISGYDSRGILYTSNRPRSLYLAEWEAFTTDIKEAEPTILEVQEEQKEKSLYPILINYLKNAEDFNVYSMRIEENSSKKSGGNSWLHPDIVGIADSLPNSENTELNEVLSKIAKNRFHLYSFEVKRNIANRNNARQAFFQTLANSSWANYAYLVCPTITNGIVLDELKMLCASFSVGLLTLNLADIEQSETIAPAKYKELDGFLTKRIAEENDDFHKYLSLVNRCYSHKEIDGDKWK